MAPANKKGNGPGRGGKGKTTGFPLMPKLKQGTEAQAQNTKETEEQQSAQEEEIYSIAAIYSGSFERKEAKIGAWQKEAAFEVTLTSTPIPEHPSLSLNLKVSVVLPAAYPKTAPKIELDLDKAVNNFYEKEMRDNLTDVVEHMLKEKKTQILVEVLWFLQEELDKVASKKAAGAKIPSLEEQRALQAAKREAKKAQEQAEKEKDDERKQEAEKAKDKTLAKNARLEASQGTPKAPKNHVTFTIAPRDNLEQDFVSDFGKKLKVEDINREEHVVLGIKQHQFFARGPVSDCYKVVPDMEVLPHQFLIVKRSRIKIPIPATATATATGTGAGEDANVDTLEHQIQSALEISQGSRHIVQIHAFDIKQVLEEDTSCWNIEILMEHGSMGSLREFIISAQELTSNRACELGLEILEGLAYLHYNGVVHRDLHAGNILLVRTEDNGNVVAKIADVKFQDTIHRMAGAPSCNQRWNEGNSSWIPPELIDENLGPYSDKTDVWFAGIILLQMLFGLDFKRLFPHINNLLFNPSNTTPSLKDLLSRMFKSKPKSRIRAEDLQNHSYFTDNNATPNSPRRRNSSVLEAHPQYLSDRFAQEFTIMEKLGQGAFGEVLKARKRLDGQEYAVKRIKESGDMPFDEIVREVKSLSSLHNIYIVRYYNAWVQKSPHPDGAESLTNEEDESEISRTMRSKSRTSKYGQSSGLSQSLDWVAKKSPLSRRMSSEDVIEEEPETEDEDESDNDRDNESDDDVDGADEYEEEGSESDEDHKESYQPSGYSNVVFDDSNPFGPGSQDVQDSQEKVDPNEDAIADSEEDEGDEGTDFDQNGAGSRILYIQMELCVENLRTAIKADDLHNDPKEIARLLRQILEGLKYIHSKNQIHRDLKPENIFFDSKDRALRTVRIGDFGLAAMGARQLLVGVQPEDEEKTGNIGTAAYVAPEVKDNLHYSAKADMYSLGVILFELCYKPLTPGMERTDVLTKLRQPNPQLPEDFNTTKLGGLEKIILKLLTHDQNERPTAEEVLASGELPDSIGIEVIRGAMSQLINPKSVFHQDVVEAMLSRRHGDDEARIKSLAWDLSNTEEPLHPCHMVMRGIVQDELTRLFRYHGAVDVSRPLVFPITAENDSVETARVLGSDGTILQLRYDLTIPLARAIATVAPKLEKFNAFGGTLKFYTFDDVYRQKPGSNKISSFGEAAFDIISDENDLTIKEAEVIKVLEEITNNFPCLAKQDICFNINHSDILSLVFDHCGVQFEHRDVAINALAQLSVAQVDWQQVERRLAAEGLSKTSVLKLHEFIFREQSEAAFSKLQTLFKDEPNILRRLYEPIAHIREVLNYLDLLGFKSKVLIAPLGCAKEKMCRGGLTFSHQVEHTGLLLAAGGRYDSLLNKFAQQDNAEPRLRHAVGFGLAWDGLTERMVDFYLDSLKAKKGKKPSEDEVAGIWRAKRCDVLVCSYDKTLLRGDALTLLNELWVSGISAEIACEARKPEDLTRAYKEDSHYWTATIKQDGSIKIRTVGQDTARNGDMKGKKNAPSDCTVSRDEVVGKFKALIRERDSSGYGSGHAVTTKRQDHMLSAGGENHITVVQSDNKNRKKNASDRVLGNVQTASMGMLQKMVNEVQTFAVDLPGEFDLEKICDTPLTADEKWKELIRESKTGEIRSRLSNLYNELLEYKGTQKTQKRPRHVIICNSRSANTVLYDVALSGST